MSIAFCGQQPAASLYAPLLAFCYACVEVIPIMFHRAISFFQYLSVLLLITSSGGNCLAQQKKKTPQSSTSTAVKSGIAYTYTIPFNANTVKVPFEQFTSHILPSVVSILAVDINDQNDLVVWFRYGTKKAIWKNGEWIAYEGQEIVSADGYKTKIDEIGKPSLGPTGKVRYRASYRVQGNYQVDGKFDDASNYRDGYFSDNRIFYERKQKSVLDFSRDGLFTPDDKVILLISTKDGLVKRSSFILNGSPTNLFPSVQPILSWGINATTGHTYSTAMIRDAKGKQKFGMFVNAGLKLSLDTAGGSSDPFLDRNDHFVYSVKRRTPQRQTEINYIDDKLISRGGYIIGCNDNHDLLTWDASLSPLLVNSTVVVMPQFGTRAGIPVIKDVGEFYAIFDTEPGLVRDFVKLNNEGQVAVVADFAGKDHKGQPCILLATPTNVKPKSQYPEPGDLVVYQNEKNEYIHVAVVTEVKTGTATVATVRSKWGSWGLYDHDPNQTIDYGKNWTVWRRKQRKQFQPEKPELSTALSWFPASENNVIDADFFETDNQTAIYSGSLEDPAPTSAQAMSIIKKARLNNVKEIEPPTTAYDCRGFVFGKKREPIAGYWWYFWSWNQVQEILDDDYEKIPAKDSTGQKH